MHKPSFNIEYIFEIIHGVIIGFAHESDFDKVENHVSEIAGFFDSPLVENTSRHQAELFKSKFSNPFDQLSA